jgi:hypothetical protein
MQPPRSQYTDQQSIPTQFLLGVTSRTLPAKHKMILAEIYFILQNHFRSLTAARIRNWSLSDPHSPDLRGATCTDRTPDLYDHQYLLRKREKEIVTLAEHIKEANRKLTEMLRKL